MSVDETTEAVNDNKDFGPDNTESVELTTIKHGIPHACLTATKTWLGKTRQREPDILDEAAMENAYNICHNVQDLLHFRGFKWAGEQTTKKKKGKKRMG